ncbi:hypothetical protein MKW92_004530 [Papaver armeniacum]|nr:hypothetical protein MKW92_004530 [Papaver armeniacum]
MSSIPEDIYLQILLRVPVKSTCVCKCVCKNWLSLISDPAFVKLHLEFTLHRNISNNLMLGGYDNRSRHSIYSISCDSLEPSVWEKNEFAVSEMCYPYLSLGKSGYKVQFVGCCNGLVCLVFSDILDREDNQDYASVGREEFFFCLWNPATQEYKKTPKPTYEIDFEDIAMYAFGYDEENKDYKLVVGATSTDTSSAVHIYTLGCDSWRSVVFVSYLFLSYWKSGVLVNGSFHWLALEGSEDSEDSLIVSFDICKERFKEMELSTKLAVPKNNPLVFITEAVLEECLCLILVFGANDPANVDDADNDPAHIEDHADNDPAHNEDHADNDPAYIEVWVMQNYGVPESWTKRYVITHEIITRNITMHYPFNLRFIFSSKNGQILLMEQGKLVLYDPKDGTAIEREMGSVLCFSSGANYFESLVSVNSGSYARKGQIEESTEAKEA